MAGALLGCVLAGGKSSRFGSDKALADLDGRSLLDHAVGALSRWCNEVVVVGREEAPVRTLPDWPAPGLGPLGGIAAALRHARLQGCGAVLTCGVDSPGLPEDLVAMLSPAPAYLAGQPVIGLWPTGALSAIETILAGDGRRSMLAFAQAISAREVTAAEEPANLNTPADLAALAERWPRQR